MSAETELYAALSGSAGLAALVSTRIYPDGIPEGSALPAIVYARASTNPVYGIGNQRFGEFARMAITAWATTRANADAAADEIQDALADSGNLPVDRSAGFDNETGLFAVSVECEWFSTN